MIELAGAISLKEVADKAEERERQRQQREALEKGEAICASQQRFAIAKQRKLTHSQSGRLTAFPFSSYKANENAVRNRSTESIPLDTEERWKQPESIAEVTEMLDFCEDAETLALIRLQSIPSEIFKIASRLLPQQKREQIRQWVVAQNAA